MCNPESETQFYQDDTHTREKLHEKLLMQSRVVGITSRIDSKTTKHFPKFKSCEIQVSRNSKGSPLDVFSHAESWTGGECDLNECPYRYKLE